MTADSTLLTDIDPNQLYLELSQEMLERTWQQTEYFSSPRRRWQAYLNRVSLSAFLSWLLEEQGIKAKVWPDEAALPYIWEVVDGVAIQFQGVRLVLVPSDSFDLSELQVFQEWVDIPSWVADYYVAVHVNPDDAYVRVFGYTTHRHLKTKGIYDPIERVYCLPEKDLITDLGVLWVSLQLCLEEIRREPVTTLPPLAIVQAENLIGRLGEASVLFPRLEIPFSLWGSLLEHEGWRRRLYEHRLEIPEQWSVRQWLETGISQVAQDLGWVKVQWETNFVTARGMESALESTVFSRQLTIAAKPYELRVFPTSGLEEGIWRFELRSSLPGSRIPTGFKLKILTEDLQPFDNNEDIATTIVDLLFVEVSLSSGEGLVWEIEPQPENNEREFLRF